MQSAPDLFSSTPGHDADHRDRLQKQLIKLADMMGDGLHHDEPWIAKEYEAICKQLYPEVYQKKRQMKAEAINTGMAKLLTEKRCSCGGFLKQVRSGSKTCQCMVCGKKYQAVKAKKKI